MRGLAALARDAGYANVFMRVHPDNDRALRCYRGAGFLPVDAHLAAEWNAVQPVGYVWLRHAGPEEDPGPSVPAGLTPARGIAPHPDKESL